MQQWHHGWAAKAFHKTNTDCNAINENGPLERQDLPCTCLACHELESVKPKINMLIMNGSSAALGEMVLSHSWLHTPDCDLYSENEME